MSNNRSSIPRRSDWSPVILAFLVPSCLGVRSLPATPKNDRFRAKSALNVLRQTLNMIL